MAKYRVQIWYSTTYNVSYDFFDEKTANKYYDRLVYNHPCLRVKIYEL